MQGSKCKSAENIVKTKFDQSFHDSENQSAINDPISDSRPGRPLQLIKIKPYGKIQVDQDALDIISSCDMPVGFCCIAGKYRTGKSFLLNRLLKIQGTGFRVDPSTTACTEGIWMWSKPLLNEREGNYIFFIDTEGSASTNRDSTNDAKVFTLANLISSYLIYNSVGAIDQKSIGQLNVVTQLSKNIILQKNADLRNNEERLSKFMPKFLWLIRDFVLQPTDRNGRRLKPKQYLQDVLFQQNTSVKSDQNVKKIRRALTKYYTDRDCVTLVRPAYEERDLQNLNQLPEHALRKDFIEGVNSLRDKILKNAGPKTYEDNPLFGGAIASMIESYVNMMNSGSLPDIHTAWQQINEDEGAFAYEQAIQRFNELCIQNFQQQQPKGQQIYHLLRVMSQSSLEQFHSHLSQPNDLYENKLKQFLAQKEQAIKQVNKQLIRSKNAEILRQCMTPVINNLQSNAYDNNPNQANIDVEEATKKYKQRAKGQDKGETLLEFLTVLNPIILNIGTKNQNSLSQQQNTDRLKRQYEMQIEAKQKQIASLRNQIESSKVVQQIKLTKDKAKAGTGKTPAANNKMTKKSTKGCCGAEGKCNIM